MIQSPGALMDALNQGAPEGDVQLLDATADRQHRQASSDRGADSGSVVWSLSISWKSGVSLSPPA